MSDSVRKVTQWQLRRRALELGRRCVTRFKPAQAKEIGFLKAQERKRLGQSEYTVRTP